jgi:hypothetical protein
MADGDLYVLPVIEREGDWLPEDDSEALPVDDFEEDIDAVAEVVTLCVKLWAADLDILGDALNAAEAEATLAVAQTLPIELGVPKGVIEESCDRVWVTRGDTEGDGEALWSQDIDVLVEGEREYEVDEVDEAAAEELLVTAAERQLVVLTVPVFDTDIERVPLTETVDVRDEVVVLETVGELLVDTVKLVETEDDILGLPEREAEVLTEGVRVSSIVRVREACAEAEVLTEGDELRVRPDRLALTLPETV